MNQAMLKAIINQMSRHINLLDDTERGLIDGAVIHPEQKIVLKMTEIDGEDAALAIQWTGGN